MINITTSTYLQDHSKTDTRTCIFVASQSNWTDCGSGGQAPREVCGLATMSTLVRVCLDVDRSKKIWVPCAIYSYAFVGCSSKRMSEFAQATYRCQVSIPPCNIFDVPSCTLVFGFRFPIFKVSHPTLQATHFLMRRKRHFGGGARGFGGTGHA